MKLSSLARLLLIVPMFVGAATSAEAAIISFTHVYDPADVTLTAGGTESSYTFTHDLSLATPSLTIPPDQVLTGTLAITVSDPGGSEDVQFSFDLGAFLSQGPTGATETFSFDLATAQGGVLINSLNADGTLQVTVRVGQQGGPTSSFVFASSQLSGRAEVGAVSAPEPASLALLATGLAGWWGVRRRGRA